MLRPGLNGQRWRQIIRPAKSSANTKIRTNSPKRNKKGNTESAERFHQQLLLFKRFKVGQRSNFDQLRGNFRSRHFVFSLSISMLLNLLRNESKWSESIYWGCLGASQDDKNKIVYGIIFFWKFSAALFRRNHQHNYQFGMLSIFGQ